MLRRALSPEEMPNRKRPPEICCTDAAADAVTAGWRVLGLDTVMARSGVVVRVAANVIIEKHSAQSDWESPHVSMSKPLSSATRSQRRYSSKWRMVVPVPKRTLSVMGPTVRRAGGAGHGWPDS